MSKKSAIEIKSSGSHGGIRETVESIVIAFVLAFLFRTFEAEAFVIPTGSMAPTLMGQHKDLVCKQCGYAFTVNASSESGEGGRPVDVVLSGLCPNCRYKAEMVDGFRKPTEPSYRGDQILVAKFPYALGDPQRFDVAVFKYPQAAKQNYIKRVVGLPDEVVRLWNGDVYRGALDAEGKPIENFAIEHKPPDKIRAMLQIVYDNDYQSRELNESGWPARWQAEAEGAWKAESEGRAFAAAGGAEEKWLRYRHLPPSQRMWRNLGEEPIWGTIQPMLITDFYAYNTYRTVGGADEVGLNWVGDLALECEIDSRDGAGEVVLELVEAGASHRCTFDLTNGQARLSSDLEPNLNATAETGIKGKGAHRVMFANVDDKLHLWVDDDIVAFSQPPILPQASTFRPPTAKDLSPVGVAARGADVRIDHLRVWRDLYYMTGLGQTMCDYGFVPQGMMSDISAWANISPRDRDFPLQKDQFLMLGDNSPCSKDSRLWGDDHWVERRLLTGKAIFIHWPHELWRIPGTNIPCPFPNFPRMGFVR